MVQGMDECRFSASASELAVEKIVLSLSEWSRRKPETGYGYITLGPDDLVKGDAYEVDGFVEKPELSYWQKNSFATGSALLEQRNVSIPGQTDFLTAGCQMSARTVGLVDGAG